ncbi:MAG: chloride channel protein [Bacteroidia bacterium]|nr:chloride channel protein [Bacteroidia bacterium]
MQNSNSINNGIPVSPSLNPTLEAENFKPQKGEDKKRLLIISGIALIIAVVVSLIARFLVYLIDLITNISFYGTFSFNHSNPIDNQLGIYVIFIPALGGIIIGFMAMYGSKAIRGHGIPEAMEQILTNHSKIKPSITYLKPLSAAISIGTGGPFGAEGPIIATGGALGSTIGQYLKISHQERKILLAAGATAGMSAIFNSPIAAIFLAIELLLFEFSPRSIIPIAIACMTGASSHFILFGHEPVFFTNQIIESPNAYTLPTYVLLGVIFGFVSVFVSKAVYFIEDKFEKLPIHWMWWPAIGGLFVGLIGYYSPRTLGVGYENIIDVLSGTLSVQILLSLCILKFISWAIALGSGTSGGTLAPLLTIGGAIGALLGLATKHYFPSIDISISLTALVGMAAVFAGSSRALLTSIIFAMETTGQQNVLVPLLISCVIAYLISYLLMKNTIMTEKIARRGINTPHSYKADVLEKITVERVLNDSGIVISEENTIKETRNFLSKEGNYQSNYFIISSNQGDYKGIISSSNLFSEHHEDSKNLGALIRRNSAYVYQNSSLRSTVETMVKENIDVLPVISDMNKQIIGVISYKDILSAYKIDVEEHEEVKSQLSIKKQQLKILLSGQKIMELAKIKRKK